MGSQATPGDVVINMNPELPTSKSNKRQDTLFGPNIGIVNSGPDWTETHLEKPSADELTPEIVKSWVAKSKQTSQPTTTLQALVNLKRPTLRLSPLALPDDPNLNTPDAHHYAHALEFEYDCDAAKCGIRVYVVLSPNHPLSKKSEDNNAARISVFETIVDGGFARVLTLEEGAVLELGQFENTGGRPSPLHAAAVHEELTGEGHSAEPSNATGDTAGNRNDRKKRFTTFHFRRPQPTRTHSVAGPALAVVDAEVGTVPSDETKENTKEVEQDEGVKVIIKLSALDGDGHGLLSANEQVTYLHVIRTGTSPVDGEEDKRPWVVQVVKREATIGPHTFHLHEIYGLSSHQITPSMHVPSPSTPDTHTYPPTTPVTSADDEPSSECLLCLSSPREVVLLPCRHLVACRECAVNMVEYGAGGTITHADTSEANPAVPATEGGENGNATNANVADPPTTTVPTQQRRRRRVKGWSCPVCRQPYTSLLRITTTLPTKEEQDSDGEKESLDHAAPVEPSVPPPVSISSRTSRLAALTRPGFLRGFRAEQPTPSDLERGMRVPAAAA
jgi:hypothetical protein